MPPEKSSKSSDENGADDVCPCLATKAMVISKVLSSNPEIKQARDGMAGPSANRKPCCPLTDQSACISCQNPHSHQIGPGKFTTCSYCQRTESSIQQNLTKLQDWKNFEDFQSVVRSNFSPSASPLASPLTIGSGTVFSDRAKTSIGRDVLDLKVDGSGRRDVELNEINRMAQEIPLFPKATSMYIHSGNIINWNRLKRKPNNTPTDELCDCISQGIEDYVQSANKTQLQYVTELYKVDNANISTLDETERNDIKITVKLFVCTPQSPSFIERAVGKVLHELGTDFVETLLLSVSPVTSADDEDTDKPVTLDVLQPYWEAMEKLVSDDKVLSLGVSDLSKEILEDLYTWAKVKPSIDQVNLESCCVMPKDLVEYAKTINVQLLTHNDRPVFLSKEHLQETIHRVSTERDSDAWVPQWVARYSGIIKARGIIKMKGYIFHGVRDNKKRIL